MRRKDREITGRENIEPILRACKTCRVAMIADGAPYVVPLNFGYTESDGNLTLYFHSARQGRKIDLIARTHRAGFELDTDYALHAGSIACDYSARFQSIIGTGTVTFVDGAAEKQAALRQIMLHNTGREDWTFSEAMLQAVCFFKLEVTSLSCKAHA